MRGVQPNPMNPKKLLIRMRCAWTPTRTAACTRMDHGSTLATFRRFCRAGMTHLGRGCPAICKDHRSPPCQAGQADFVDFERATIRSHALGRHRSTPRLASGARSRRPRGPIHRNRCQGGLGVLRNELALHGLAKAAFENRAGRAIRLAPGQRHASASPTGFERDFGHLDLTTPCSATAKSLIRHPAAPVRGSGGDSHAPPAFSTAIHRL
jgi:hypothetical protein